MVSQVSIPVPGERRSPGSFIVVPPNGARYKYPAVMERLETFVRERLPMYEIEVPWVEQPRVESFTVVAHGAADDIARAEAKEIILRTLAEFDPEPPELKLD